MRIEKNPPVKKLPPKAKELLTELCFRKNDELQKVDGIFVYASCTGIEELVVLVNKILTQQLSSKIFITGGITPPKYRRDSQQTTHLTEADSILSALQPDQHKNLEVFVEKKSTNTLENVTETLHYPEFKHCKSLLFVFKSHAAGRGYLTLRKFFPKAMILQQTFDTKYEQANKEISRDNWHTFEFGRSRVWGEFLRIKTYGSRGDIEYNEVKQLVVQIENEIKAQTKH